MATYLFKIQNNQADGDRSRDRSVTLAPPSSPIEKCFSLYLDLVRFSAALSVFISHSVQYHLYDGYVPLASYGHDSLVIFFVLSGLVISATAARAGETSVTYLIARASRIYSVAIPAIALSYAVTGLAAYLIPNLSFGEPAHADLSLPTIITAILFLLQSWHSQDLLWNTPYWSLCYEVWYYLIFGAIFFIRHVKLKAAIALLAAMIAGPAIILLFPIWLLGVWITRHPYFSIVSKAASCTVFFGSWAAIAILNDSGLAIMVAKYLYTHVPSYWRLYASQRFATDYLIGFLIFLNFVAFRSIQGYFSASSRVLAPAIRFFAGYTFSLYLYHYPLIRFCEAVFPNKTNSFGMYLATMTTIFGMCLLLGHFTEKQKWVVRALIIRVAGMVSRSATSVRSPAR